MENVPSDSWKWFCGKNSSDLALFDDFNWDKAHVLGNSCLVDAYIGSIHFLFLIIFLSTLWFYGFICKATKSSSTEIFKFPAHVIIWLCMIGLLILYACAIGEGILSDRLSYNKFTSYTQVHLYIPFVVGFIVSLISTLFFHLVESWRGFLILWILACYNGLVITGEAVKLASLIYIDIGSTSVVRFDLSLFFLVLHGIIFISMLYIIGSQVSK